MKLHRIAFLYALAAVAQQPEPAFKFEVTTQLVVVNVQVRDSDGRPVENLGRDAFTVLEDGKPQKLSIFEFQRLESAGEMPAAAPAAAPKPGARPEITPSKPGEVRYKDRRLMVLFFDFSSMESAEQLRAQKSALAFIDQKMTPADLVAIMSFSTRLRVVQDFTDDRTRLTEAIKRFRIGETGDLASTAATGEDSNGEDTGAAFTADESEFNVFNTDRKLSALEMATKMLSSLPEKKALVYFSSGVGKTGVENQSQLRATVNAAMRANVSFYPVDARGLVAEAPLGDASTAGSRGSSMYSGAAQQQRREQFSDQQETLVTLAADTGGKALLDNNDLTLGIVQAQKDIASYYILGYYSTNPATDGRYRRIAVRIQSQPRAKLDYRSGYFASKSFRDFSGGDKERQLEEALLLGDPITDLPVALEVDYFRRAADRYIVPLAVKVPGSAIQLARSRDVEKTRLDFIAQVRNSKGAVVAGLRDHIEVKLKGTAAAEWNNRQLQYDSAFTLPPGAYSLKFLVRENETGRMGTFETRFEVPDLALEKSYLRLSSVIWSNQWEPLSAAVGQAGQDRRSLTNHPLVKEGQKLIPSITKVFRKDQKLYVFFETYDTGRIPDTKAASLSVSLSIFRQGNKVFESEARRIDANIEARSGALPVDLEVPLEQIGSGEYVCQLNVMDEHGRKFAFRRSPLIVLP